MKMRQIKMLCKNLAFGIEVYEMKIKYYMSILGAPFLLIVHACYAASLDWPEFKALAQDVPIIGRVEITSKEAVIGIGKSSEVCGYRFHAHVEQMFKGPELKEITFFSGSDDDVLEGYPEYLLVAFENQKPNSGQAKQKCDSLSKYAVGDFEQTLFPIRNNPGTGKPEYLLVNRTSPFTTGNFVYADEYVKTFIIKDRRIYALVAWDKVISDLHNVTVDQQ